MYCSNVDQNRAVRRVFDEKVIENVMRMALRMSIDQVIRGDFFRFAGSVAQNAIM